jgi:hypothetical protein
VRQRRPRILHPPNKCTAPALPVGEAANRVRCPAGTFPVARTGVGGHPPPPPYPGDDPSYHAGCAPDGKTAVVSGAPSGPSRGAPTDRVLLMQCHLAVGPPVGRRAGAKSGRYPAVSVGYWGWVMQVCRKAAYFRSACVGSRPARPFLRPSPGQAGPDMITVVLFFVVVLHSHRVRKFREEKSFHDHDMSCCYLLSREPLGLLKFR